MVSLDALKRLKWGYAITHDERISLCECIEKDLEVLKIIFNSPFIIDNLAELGKLPPEAMKRYLFGTITNSEVEKVEEFFKNGEK